MLYLGFPLPLLLLTIDNELSTHATIHEMIQKKPAK